MDSTNILDYESELIRLCGNCPKSLKCKDTSKLCIRKKLAFSIAKRVYKQRLKKGEVK